MARTGKIEHIAAAFTKEARILLFPHINMDGDALGSCVALCRGLRSLGMSCFVLTKDSIPEYIRFLDNGYCVSEAPYRADISVAVDCGDSGRIEDRKEEFYGASKKLCIDHHLIKEDFADVRLVDPEASATGMLIFELLNCLNVSIDKEMAEAMYTAILTDTGSFRYSNADKATHMTVAQLMDYGIDSSRICTRIYDSLPKEQLDIENMVFSRLKLFSDGKGLISYCTRAMLDEAKATPDLTETAIDRLRKLRGVEIAVFLKEKDDGTFKASFRSKGDATVSTIAQSLGGGGHAKAAGCTLRLPLDEALAVAEKATAAELLRLEEAQHI